MSPSLNERQSDSIPPERIVHQEIRAELERMRSRLNTEIGQYPSPIPACDAQFNHLLEQRSRISRELARLCTADREGWSLFRYTAYFDELVASSDLIGRGSEPRIRAYLIQTDDC